MKIGYMTDSHAGPHGAPLPSGPECADFYEYVISEAVLAEACGYHGAFVPERHARTETVCSSPMMMLMAMAARTDRIALGTFVLQPGYYNPAHLAEAVTAVDSVSRGRLILGLGAGYHEGYFRHFGEPFERRAPRLEESVAFLRRAFTGDRFDWNGDDWTLADVLVTPRPFRPQGPPLWIAGTADRPLRRAGRLGDGVALLSLMTPLAKMREWAQSYRDAALEAGRTPVVAALFDGYVGPDDAEAAATYAAILASDARTDFYLRWGMLRAEDLQRDRGVDSDTLLVGSAATVAEKVRAIQSALSLGADDWLIFKSRTQWGPAPDDVAASIRRFGEAVAPAVREAV